MAPRTLQPLLWALVAANAIALVAGATVRIPASCAPATYFAVDGSACVSALSQPATECPAACTAYAAAVGVPCLADTANDGTLLGGPASSQEVATLALCGFDASGAAAGQPSIEFPISCDRAVMTGEAAAAFSAACAAATASAVVGSAACPLQCKAYIQLMGEQCVLEQEVQGRLFTYSLPEDDAAAATQPRELAAACYSQQYDAAGPTPAIGGPVPIAPDSSSASLSGGAIAGIVAGCAAFAALALMLALRVRRRRGGAECEPGKLGLPIIATSPGSRQSSGRAWAPWLRLELPSSKKQGSPKGVLTPDGSMTTVPSFQDPLLEWAAGLQSVDYSDAGMAQFKVKYSDLAMGEMLGEGSFGKVFFAMWKKTPVAVKMLVDTSSELPFADAPDTPSPVLEALRGEVRMLAELRHKNIVLYMGACISPPCIVTEFCGLRSLEKVLKQGRNDERMAQQLGWYKRIRMALDAAKGMNYLHDRTPAMAHRDLKSPNLLVDTSWHVKVADFNLSRILEGTDALSSPGVTNPRWLAPEVLAGGGGDCAADRYAFGIILWELMTWQMPWANASVWQLSQEIIGGLRPKIPAPETLPGPDAEPFAGLGRYIELMQACWQHDPAARPSFGVCCDVLRDLLQVHFS